MAEAPHAVKDCRQPDRHCHEHDVDDEPLAGYRYCLECGHMYTTPEELLAGHNRILASLGMEPETDAEQVHTCPLCIHDF